MCLKILNIKYQEILINGSKIRAKTKSQLSRAAPIFAAAQENVPYGQMYAILV
jgi:hypothetical protein